MIITNFSSGELSKKMSGRADLQQYYSACSYLKNFNIIPTGGLERRVGLKRIGELSGECRLIPFILDSNTSFIFEFRPNIIYVWKNGEKMTDTAGNQVTIETSYASISEINEIHYAQDYDTMIFVQRNYPPFQVTYDFSLNVFSYANMTFSFYPDVNLDNDYEDAPITVCDTDFPADPDDGDYAIKDGRLYKYNAENSTWENNDDDPEVDEELFSAENKYPGCVTFFNNRLYFASTIAKRQKVWASATPDTEGTRYNSFATYQKYVTVNKVVKDADLHVFTADVTGAATYTAASFSSDLATAQSQFASGTYYYKNSDGEYIEASAYNAGTTYYSVTGTTDCYVLSNVSQDLSDALSKDASLYYCSNDSYISVGTKVVSIDFDNKTITLDTPVSTTKNLYSITFTIQLWRDASAASADDYEYSVVSNNTTTSDCSFNFELASDQNDAIKFLASNQYLTIGTESSVWSVPSTVSALSIAAQMNGRYGSDGIQAHCVDTAVIFFSQGLKGIREYYYNAEKEAFQTNNIALQAEQMLTESAAVDFDFLTNPYNRIMIVRADGTAVCLLYDKNNGVMGWTRIESEYGAIKSCAVTRGDDESDLTYFSVKEGDKYYLELLDPLQKVYLDSWKEYEEGDEDNYTSDAVKTEDGKYIGYKFESKVTSLPIIASDPTAKKRIVNLLVRFLDSYMPVMECTDSDTEYFTDIEEPYSGIAQIDYPGVTDRDVTFTISIDDPKCCNILAVNAKLSS